MAKQTELKERGTNTLLYPVTTVAQVLGTDGNPITDKVLPTKGAEGTILTVKNGAVTWDAPTSGEITSADVKMQGTNTMLNQVLTPDELTITDGTHSIYVSSSSNAIHTGDQDLNLGLDGVTPQVVFKSPAKVSSTISGTNWNVNNSGKATFNEVNGKIVPTSISVPSGTDIIRFDGASNVLQGYYNDPITPTWAISNELGLGQFKSVKATDSFITPAINNTSSTWNIASNGDAKFKDVIADDYKILSNGSIMLDGDDFTIELNQYGTHRSDGQNGHPELYCNDDLSIVTPSNLVIESAKITNAQGTFEITDQGSIFDDLFTNNLTTNNLITKDLDSFVKTANLQGDTILTIGETNRNYEICFTQPIGNNYTKKVSDWYIDQEGARFKKLELISNQTTDSLVFDIVDDEFYRISTTESALYIGSETNTNEITFNQSIYLCGEDIYYRSSNTTKSIKAADLNLINYIKGIGSGIALVPESEGSSKLTNTKITLNHYLDIIILNGNYSLMLESGYVSKLPAIGKHVVFQNDSIETRIITLPNNASIKSDKETLTVTAKGYAEIDLIKGSTGTILIKSSVL